MTKNPFFGFVQEFIMQDPTYFVNRPGGWAGLIGKRSSKFMGGNAENLQGKCGNYATIEEKQTECFENIVPNEKNEKIVINATIGTRRMEGR